MRRTIRLAMTSLATLLLAGCRGGLGNVFDIW